MVLVTADQHPNMKIRKKEGEGMNWKVLLHNIGLICALVWSLLVAVAFYNIMLTGTYTIREPIVLVAITEFSLAVFASCYLLFLLVRWTLRVRRGDIQNENVEE
jgi:hypothetical protein